jgi:hypothetical protein
MKIYVAARFGQYERARALMDDLAAAGHEITHDWTRTEEFDADGRPRFREAGTGDAPTTIPAERLTRHADDDVRACQRAEAIVVLADEPLCGALIEIGVGLASGCPVYVCAPWRWTVFWEHPLVTVLPDEDAAREMFGVQAITAQTP